MTRFTDPSRLSRAPLMRALGTLIALTPTPSHSGNAID